ncbi:MAG: hypothetical protein LBH19_06850, partial [Dysgonamonadaceae bacterium]|nr:hypothetical protein [Dysgonamonadaceae bacterium]
MNKLSSFLQKSKIMLLFFMPAVFFSSCNSYLAAMKEYNSQESNLYEGTVYLLDGARKTGETALPNYESATVLFFDSKGNKETIPAEDIEKIELFNSFAPDRIYSAHYLPVKSVSGKNKNRWVVKLSDGKYVQAYIGAAGYKIDKDGSLVLGGYQYRQQGATIQPSFPVYMVRNNESKLTMVGMKGGVHLEGSAFRSGVSRYLKDDPQLMEYIRNAKWDISNLSEITENYIPNRTENQPLLFAAVSAPFLTDDLTKEVICYAETIFPEGSAPMYGLGIKVNPHKFITLAGDVNCGQFEFISYDKRIDNHLFNNLYTDPVIPEDYARGTALNFNVSAGLQLPMRLKNIYLAPSANINFGGLFVPAEAGYENFYYGPGGMLDIGYKLKYGNIIMLGFG